MYPLFSNQPRHCILITFFFLSVIFFASSCSNNREGWKSISSEFDAVNTTLDSLYFDDKLTSSASPIVDSLVTLSEKYPGKESSARVLYWQAMMIKGDITGSHLLLDSARNLVDSVKDPYLYARVDAADKYFDKSDYLKRYSRLSSAIEYSIKHKDPHLQLMARRSRSHFFLTLNDLKHYYDEIKEIDRLCISMGQDSLAQRNRLNFALYYIQQGNKNKASQILKELLATKQLQNDSLFISKVYINLATLLDDPSYYQQAIDITPQATRTDSYVLTLQFSMAQIYEKKGDYIRADSLLSFLIPAIEEDGDASAKAVLHRIYSHRRERAGDYKGALMEHRESEKWEASLYSSAQHAAVSELDLHETLERVERESYQNKLLQTFRWIIALLIVACFSVFGLYLYRSRTSRLKIEKSRAEARMAELALDLERKKRSMVAMGIAVNETDALSQHLVDKVEQMHDTGSISTGVKNELTQIVKQSASGRKELNDLQYAYEELHPDFLNRLAEKYPNLTQGEIKLSLYISIGLGTKQIAQLLHIQPDSVKKSRQRLRRRMGLAQDESLEQILRDIL